ncbi:MAG: hypothetical protein P4L50_20140 [Anaerolineaceae bacterium]|nr:hypothetical protein [Anaerolineaceae bacterium]
MKGLTRSQVESKTGEMVCYQRAALTSTIPEGHKYQFDLGGDPAEFKWHAPDSNVLKKFRSSSNSGTMWTAQIIVNNELLGSDGAFYPIQQGNLTHIPVK